MNRLINRKESMLQAQKHEKFITGYFKSYIADSIKKTLIYNKKDGVISTYSNFKGCHTFKPQQTKGKTASTFIWPISGQSAVIKAYQNNPKSRIAILNFASYSNPGGGWLTGARAQEESLCGASTLYPVISAQDEYYQYNRKHNNNRLYLDRALYSPGILWFVPGATISRAKAAVITCAAPFRTYASDKKKADEALEKRCLFVKEIAEHENINTLILGAWGAGAFGFSADFIAKAWLKTFAKGTSIKQIIYAVITDKKDKNTLTAFQKEFDDK